MTVYSILEVNCLGSNPSIEIEKDKYDKGKTGKLKIDNFEFSMDASTLKEIAEEINQQFLPYEQTQAGLEERIEELEQEVEQLTEQRSA
jgi:hypothetical protein